MSKFRSLILIIGLLIIAVATALLTVLILYASGALVTDPIELIYSVESVSKTYDGTPLVAENYYLESGSVLEGHTAQVVIVGSQTDAGESESTLEVKVFDKKGFDVTDEYAVKVNVGTLTVEKQYLSVVIPDSKVVYSGKEVYFNEYQIIDGTLAKGHKIAGANASLLNVGKLPADVQPVIYDAFDNDVTNNYYIDYEMGSVEILPRPLTVKPKDVSKVYDGTALTATEYEITSGSLASGQTLSYTVVTTSGGEASAENCVEGLRIKFGTFKILDEDGAEVDLNNYDYTLETGLLTVEKRALTISTATEAFTYNGEQQYNSKLDIFSGTLAPNQIITVTDFTAVTEVTTAVENNVTCDITYNGSSVISNYNITYITGSLTVNPLNLTVYTKSYSKEYDGETMGDFIDSDEANYELKVDLSAKFTIVTDYANTVKERTDVISETSYKLTSVRIILRGENDEDCTDNFVISVMAGKYSITPRQITIQSPSATFEYDGAEHFQTDGSVYSGLVAGHALNVLDYTKVTAVTDSGLNLIDYDIVSGTDSVYHNYTVNISYGTLTVLKKSLTVESESYSFEYDGEEHSYTEKYNTVGLLDIHRISVNEASATKVTDVTSGVSNVFSYSILNEAEEDVSGNYEINFIAGILEVTKKAITVITESDEKVYDGFPLSNDGGTADDLLLGHTLSLIGVAPSIIDAGELINEQKFVILSGNGEEVTGNYEITYEYGTLTVTPATLQVVLNDLEETYSGNAYQVDKASAFAGLDLENLTYDEFNIVEFSEMKNAGTYYYSAEYTGTLKNYTLYIEKGTFIINRKEVNLETTLTEVDMQYNGSDSYFSDDGKIISALTVDGHNVSSAVLDKQFDTITVLSVTVSGGNEGDLTGNYEINCNVSITVNVTARAFSFVLGVYANNYYVNTQELPACVSATGLAAGDRLVINGVGTNQIDSYWVTEWDIVNSKGESVKGYYAATNEGATGKMVIIY